MTSLCHESRDRVSTTAVWSCIPLKATAMPRECSLVLQDTDERHELYTCAADQLYRVHIQQQKVCCCILFMFVNESLILNCCKAGLSNLLRVAWTHTLVWCVTRKSRWQAEPNLLQNPKLHGLKTQKSVLLTYIVTYSGLAWLIIIGSGVDDWVY